MADIDDQTLDPGIEIDGIDDADDIQVEMTDLPEGADGIHTGNPVRRAVHERAGAPYIVPGDYPMGVLVIGGSQGARILSDVVPEALAAQPEEVRAHLRVSHQARPEDAERVTAAYAQAGIDAEVKPFFHDVPARMTEAQLVIARAGASTIADLTVIGRPSILIPYAAATADHQSANARALVEAGAAIMIPQDLAEPAVLAAQITAVLTDPAAALHMSQAATGAGAPDATERLVALVEGLAEKETR